MIGMFAKAGKTVKKGGGKKAGLERQEGRKNGQKSKRKDEVL